MLRFRFIALVFIIFAIVSAVAAVPPVGAGVPHGGQIMKNAIEQEKIKTHGNEVSAFVHFLQAERENQTFFGNESHGIGPQVSAFATQFNNSLKTEDDAQNQIKSRNGITKFFLGGDASAAKRMGDEANVTSKNIARLRAIIDNCQDCDVDVKATLQEQLDIVQLQQDIFAQMARDELGNKGLFGWLFR